MTRPRTFAPLLALVLAGCPFITDDDFDDRFDADGDGVLRPDDCDDTDKDIGEKFERFADVDRDGFGDPTSVVLACANDASASDDASDCDDSRPLVNPDMDEACNALDDDCDGDIDEEDAVDALTWYPDNDRDGRGEFGSPGIVACSVSAAYVSNNDDCDDDDATTNTFIWFEDADGDGQGTSDTAGRVQACEDPSTDALAYTRETGDCDDTDAAINKWAAEVCDEGDAGSIDEDCNGLADDDDVAATGQKRWFSDADGDGYGDIHDMVLACDPIEGRVLDDSDCDDDWFDAVYDDECPFTDVSVGLDGVCAVRSNGRLECDGDDWIVDSQPAGGFLSVGVGSDHACAVGVSGSLRCWGEPSTVLDALIDESEPGGTDRWEQVSVDTNQTCALSDEGEIKCWADGIEYEVTTETKYVSVDAGTYHACGLSEDGYADCFGSCSDNGECEEPNIVFDQVVAGQGYSCGIARSNSRITCWGNRGSGIGSVFQASLIDAYQDVSCAITVGGYFVCWGDAGEYEEFEGDDAFMQLDVGSDSACAIDLWGELYCEDA